MNPTRFDSLEKFEKIAGTWFVIFSIWFPIPFIGILNLFQIAILFIIRYNGNDFMRDVAPFNIFFMIVAAILFICGLVVMIGKKKYRSYPMWLRMIIYPFLILIYFLFYALYAGGYQTRY